MPCTPDAHDGRHYVSRAGDCAIPSDLRHNLLPMFRRRFLEAPGIVVPLRRGDTLRPRTDLIKQAERTSMNPNQALWEKGDFTRIADTMRESGDAAVEGLGAIKGLKVLDLGCGDGTTALPAARRGAEVLGVDIARNLVAAGNARAKAQGLTNCVFREGDASNLHQLDDHSFDLVVSMFGAMFAPRPFDVAKEMVRVTRPGGRIVMANWIPGDPTLVAQTLQISSAYSPPPPEGFVSPMTWGIEANVIERFGAAGIPAEKISFSETRSPSGLPAHLHRLSLTSETTTGRR
jgi:ubiquinone/menaquinone biosynthesis C-methylase UbiE